MKTFLLYSYVHTFYKFHIILPDSLFLVHSSKGPVISSIHKQWINNYFCIYSALVLIVSCVLGVILFSVNQIINGQVVMDRTGR